MDRLKCFIKGIAVFILYFLIMPAFFSIILTKYFSKNNKIVINLELSVVEIAMFIVLFLIYKKTIINH